MTEVIAGVPFRTLHIAGDGSRLDHHSDLVPPGTTDLIVLSHGWKNAADDATSLYAGLLEAMAAEGRFDGGPRRFATVGVYWPAFRFERDLSLVSDRPLIAGEGGAASATSGPARSEMHERARMIGSILGDDPDAFAASALAAAGGGGAANDFVERLRGSLSPTSDDVVREHLDLLQMRGSDLLEDLAQGGARFSEGSENDDFDLVGASAAFPTASSSGWSMLSGGKAAVASVLNQCTYYEMKARAGLVGTALAGVLDGAVPVGTIVHLVGHSFGARLATAAASVMATPVRSLSLLQGAFSHNAFGTGIGRQGVEGWFRALIADGTVSGPILVTHTRRDRAVGLFYALASSASGDIAKASLLERVVGGPDDPHGGLGANGARLMLDGEVVESVATAEAAPELVCGKVNNVKCDAIIGDHSDVVNSAVGDLVWRAVSADG